MSESLCLACLMPDVGLEVCPHCGWQRGSPARNPQHLAPGTALNPPYRVAHVLGHGGFGITYLGWDANLQIKVAIKEFLPREFAQRDPRTGRVVPHADDTLHYFETGLQRFLEEARILAKFQQHPGIVSVLSFFRAFGTGYLVMEYIEGETLKHYLARGLGRLNWQQTLDVFMQVMDALRAVHQAGLLHRDIAPDNIYLCDDGRVKLLDFGEARYALKAQTQALVVVKPGFAAEEQYRSNGQQGPWTDVYAVAACIYHCLTGQAPPDAMARLQRDTLSPPREQGVVMPDETERALLLALSLRACHRPQSIAAFQRLISVERPVETQPQLAQNPAPPDVELLMARAIDLTAKREKPLFSWQRWLVFGGLSLALLLMLYRLASTMRSPPMPDQNVVPQQEDISPVGELGHEETVIDWSRQRAREREAAEFLRQQQDAALKRFEDYRRQSTPNTTQAQPERERLEHLQRLCEEWGATMECPKDLQPK